MISNAIQIILALPKIIGVAVSVIKAVKELNEQLKKNKLIEAIEKGKNATTEEQTKQLSSDIAANLP